MKKLLIFFYLIPLVSFSQIIISANVIERTDTKKKITNILDLSIGSFINNDLIVGITNEEDVADYIEYEFNPIQDSFIISNLQFFIKYYDDKGYFFLMKIPTSSNIKGISIYDRIRVGGGYIFYSDYNLNFHVSYDLLLNPNLNGWDKGKLNLGISKNISNLDKNKKIIKLPTTSFDSSLLNRFISWINTPLSNGYRASVLN